MPKSAIPQSCILLHASIPAHRADMDSGGGIYDRQTVIRIARELIKKAQNPALEAIRLDLDSNGIGISVGSR